MIEKVLLLVAWLVAAPAAAAPPASEWQPPVAHDPAALDTAHLHVERLHERWMPATIDWTVPREFALSLACDLSLITLAIMDCDRLTAERSASVHPVDVLILSPRKSAAASAASGEPDFHDLRRRPIEERMHSI